MPTAVADVSNGRLQFKKAGGRVGKLLESVTPEPSRRPCTGNCSRTR